MAISPAGVASLAIKARKIEAATLANWAVNLLSFLYRSRRPLNS
jgi:hypothetical protein